MLVAHFLNNFLQVSKVRFKNSEAPSSEIKFKENPRRLLKLNSLAKFDVSPFC